MKSVLYLGCPASDRAETKKILATADLAVVWADSAASALSQLQRRDMPVLLDLSRGAAALQTARELRTRCAGTPMFAVVDSRRPHLTTEAVLAGMADAYVPGSPFIEDVFATGKVLYMRNATGPWVRDARDANDEMMSWRWRGCFSLPDRGGSAATRRPHAGRGVNRSEGR